MLFLYFCMLSYTFQQIHVTHFITIQYVPYMQTFKLPTFKDTNMCMHIESCKLVHVSGVHCHMHAFSGRSCAFVYLTLQHCIECSCSIFIDRIESSKEMEPRASASDMSEMAARPPPAVTDEPSALPPPTSPPSSSQ